jgi:sulfatase modifying factor 1
MLRSHRITIVLCLVFGGEFLAAAPLPTEKTFTNSLGMRFRQIESDQFWMGTPNGVEFDERPVRRVKISRAFHLGVNEVTNAQYEAFDKEHCHFRGKHELSKGPDDAVLYVSWHDAVAFCEWLSEKEGLPYRLPTEAEWEYACRAGTTTSYHTGSELSAEYHREQERRAFPLPVDLTVGLTPANAWGLHDMHGSVEEWCSDWYGPYPAAPQTDPVGPADGDFRITRGGSHNTKVRHLRSANRMGTLPADKHWLIGFRVALGEPPQTPPTPPSESELWAQDVTQERHDWTGGPDPEKPYFHGPEQFVHIAPGSNGPMFSAHNHQPAITACPNGDLLAIWYSTVQEKGRNLIVVAARLRRGETQWEPAAPFWDAPDRNDHGSSILWDHRDDTLYHFNGLSTSGTWGNLALVMRTSRDSGVTWSKARIIQPVHGYRKQVIAGAFITREGYMIVPCDAVPSGNGGSALHVSRDRGRTWDDPGGGRPIPKFEAGQSGAWIAGIHTGCAQLNDGSLLAFGRGDPIGGKMPMSISADMGKNWTYSASEFPRIGGGQRLVLLRLREGPLFLGTFSRDGSVTVHDASGGARPVQGFFGALSYDEGKSWPLKRLVSDDGPGRTCRRMDGHEFQMSLSEAEPGGYFAATQTPDGVIHLISSWNHYAFNLKWLETAPPARAVVR